MTVAKVFDVVMKSFRRGNAAVCLDSQYIGVICLANLTGVWMCEGGRQKCVKLIYMQILFIEMQIYLKVIGWQFEVYFNRNVISLLGN